METNPFPDWGGAREHAFAFATARPLPPPLQKRPLPSHAVGELTLKIHSVLSSAETRLQSHPAPQAARDALEKLVLTQLYRSVFAVGDGDAKSDAALSAQLTRLQACRACATSA